MDVPPLDGVLVADFSRVLAGPLCTMMLGDAGARVVKVEQPGRGDETRQWGPPFLGSESTYYLSVNRNKSSLTIDLGSDEGREQAMRLVERADIVVENFLPATRSRLGLDPEAIRTTNPAVIHCSILGYDSDSDEAALPGYDLLAQAGSGLMWITGPSDGPPMKAGVALADVLTAHWAHGAILSALYQREKSGLGQHLEVSLAGAMAASLVNVAQAALATNEEARRHGNAHPSIVPYQAFETTDGWIVVAAATNEQYIRLCNEVLERPELAQDHRYRTNADRVRNRDQLVPELARTLITASSQAWVDRCRSAGVPASKVRGVREVLDRQDAPVITVDHPTLGPLSMVRNPIRRNGRYQETASAPPLLGADNQD